MAIVRKTPVPSCKKKEESEKQSEYNYKSEIMLTTMFKVKQNQRKSEPMKFEVEEVPINEALYAIIKDCRLSRKGTHILVVFDIYTNTGVMEQTFFYNMKSKSKEYLYNLANKFEEFKKNMDLKDIIGCAAIVKMSTYNGFLNISVKRQVSYQELDEKLCSLAKGITEYNTEEEDDYENE